MRSEKVEFEGASGARLAGRLEMPSRPPTAFAVFAHCFTCSKDSSAATRISRALAELGIATLRFDFTGLGRSGGDFENTNYSSNVDDLVAAASYLRDHHAAPALLVGHSLGGAAVLSASRKIPESRAVVTIGAPASTDHVLGHLPDARERLQTADRVDVCIAGRPFTVRRQFFEDVESQHLLQDVEHLGRALLVCHAPLDQVVGVDNASAIFRAARHPKSFVSLDDADHLLTRRADAAYVARIVAAWASRYVGAQEDAPAESARHATTGAPEARGERPAGEVVVTQAGEGRFAQTVRIGEHELVSDEPERFGGLDLGPSPYGLLLASLGSCTAMTLQLYAERKGLALEGVEVTLSHERVHAQDCSECEDREGRVDVVERVIALRGDLTDSERARMLEIADKCPVHRTLASSVVIRSREEPR